MGVRQLVFRTLIRLNQLLQYHQKWPDFTSTERKFQCSQYTIASFITWQTAEYWVKLFEQRLIGYYYIHRGALRIATTQSNLVRKLIHGNILDSRKIVDNNKESFNQEPVINRQAFLIEDVSLNCYNELTNAWLGNFIVHCEHHYRKLTSYRATSGYLSLKSHVCGGKPNSRINFLSQVC